MRPVLRLALEKWALAGQIVVRLRNANQSGEKCLGQTRSLDRCLIGDRVSPCLRKPNGVLNRSEATTRKVYAMSVPAAVREDRATLFAKLENPRTQPTSGNGWPKNVDWTVESTHPAGGPLPHQAGDGTATESLLGNGHSRWLGAREVEVCTMSATSAAQWLPSLGMKRL